MACIPDAFIDDLLARTDIVELVGARVPLKRQGKEYAARCPFHDERSASFTVSPTKQFYHCFGCGAHGTAISFLMNFDRLEFLDAVDELAKRAGMEVPRDTRQRNEDSGTRDLYGALDAAARFFRQQLGWAYGAGLVEAKERAAGRPHNDAPRLSPFGPQLRGLFAVLRELASGNGRPEYLEDAWYTLVRQLAWWSGGWAGLISGRRRFG